MIDDVLRRLNELERRSVPRWAFLTAVLLLAIVIGLVLYLLVTFRSRIDGELDSRAADRDRQTCALLDGRTDAQAEAIRRAVELDSQAVGRPFVCQPTAAKGKGKRPTPTPTPLVSIGPGGQVIVVRPGAASGPVPTAAPAPPTRPSPQPTPLVIPPSRPSPSPTPLLRVCTRVLHRCVRLSARLPSRRGAASTLDA